MKKSDLKMVCGIRVEYKCEDFILPFSGKLSADNSWVQLANITPWDELEKQYAFMFLIVRGKAGAAVEFGAKVAISLEDGFFCKEHGIWLSGPRSRSSCNQCRLEKS